MRVLNNKVLVTVKKKTGGLVLEDEDVRKGRVYLSGSDQVHKNEEVMFGDDFEEIQMGGEHRAFLMDQENIKIVFGE
jgi:hypothetical protein